MKMYVVTSGSYSDYHIMEIFASKKKAQYFAKHSKWSATVEEYKVRSNHVPYSWRTIVWMDRDGNVLQTCGPYIVSSEDYEDDPYKRVIITHIGQVQCIRYQSSSSNLTSVIKKTNEIRSALLIAANGILVKLSDDHQVDHQGYIMQLLKDQKILK